YLPIYKKAADTIESSKLNYTILRPAWLSDINEIDYEITHKNEPFKGTEVSRKSVAAVAVQIAKNPELYLNDNIGISKPNTDFSKPRWK
ncbi:NAD-dependent dehydratase, partial [Mesorhizobium sp. M00.F.Ca.ET.217.01.1.1]